MFQRFSALWQESNICLSFPFLKIFSLCGPPEYQLRLVRQTALLSLSKAISLREEKTLGVMLGEPVANTILLLSTHPNPHNYYRGRKNRSEDHPTRVYSKIVSTFLWNGLEFGYKSY